MADAVKLLTVGELKRILQSVPDDVAVSLALPPDLPTVPGTVFYSARVRYSGGPVLHMVPAGKSYESFPVDETFPIAGRGLAIVLDPSAGFSPGARVTAVLVTPDNIRTEWAATLELSLLSTPHRHEKLVALLQGATEAQAPKGSLLTLSSAG